MSDASLVIFRALADQGILVDVRSKIDPASLRADLCYWSL
jgi:hypothetical protein